ncbi:hypothetical protein PR202_ga22700 [Eleusine coracana subsp. coracana]|uniref:Uncharacterized protein n=1 Tax=Eleusine coracana subsp. coracana TaxID=191504 RepID=A0AAV5D2E6_ELECO|nr:hypothetical protein PR202_ga22700 [Eleusine coracana subsp. coracana]
MTLPPPQKVLLSASATSMHQDSGEEQVWDLNRSRLAVACCKQETKGREFMSMDLVTGALGSVIPKLALLLKEEYDLQTGVRKKITRLSRDLESMHAVLRKVAQVPPEQLDDEVKLWAHDVRELSYDIEDILDTFLVRVEDHEACDPNRFKHAAKKISKMFSKSKARHQIGGMIKIINEQAERVDRAYLIVIDDIWKIETWKRINYALVENNNGSIIIITTRHSDVADEADVNYKLEPLPRGQSEKLFYTRIFGTNGTCPNNQLKEDCNDVNLEHVENLLHLRYLGLKGTETCKLPEGVGALKLLQTLDFDLAFNKEKEDAPDKLPSSLGLLTDLICLRAGLAMVPNGVIKKLTSLEELQMSTSYDDTQSNASYYTSRHFVEDLGNLCELRVLIADFWVGEGEEECTELDLVKSLSNLKKIQHLELDCQILIKYQPCGTPWCFRNLSEVWLHVTSTSLRCHHGLIPQLFPTSLAWT